MTKKQAHTLLNRLRKGIDAAPHEINKALYITGDLDEMPVARVIRPAGTWERKASAGHLATATPWDALA